MARLGSPASESYEESNLDSYLLHTDIGWCTFIFDHGNRSFADEGACDKSK